MPIEISVQELADNRPSPVAHDDIGRFPIPLSFQLRWIRFVAYPLLILLGIVRAWSTRHFMLSDGISYLEIAAAYLHRDWTNAVNAYWSPLYSWTLALAFWVLKPTPYWQVATLHLVNFLAYLGALVFLELFLFEVTQSLRTGPLAGMGNISTATVYIAGYAVFPLAALSIIEYPSPDILATALMLLLFFLFLRVRRTGGSRLLFVSIGLLCAVLYLDRTAFFVSIPICIAVVLILLKQQGKPLGYPALLMLLAALAVAGPFVVAISRKHGGFTLGESGKLTYGWEVAGAARWMYWQGEPGDIGKPVHPPKRVTTHPATYIFDGPVGGTFPPWFDPSYWYEGIHPKLKLRAQLWALAVNSSCILSLLAFSPITIPCLLLIWHQGILRWLRRFFFFWPVLVPTIAGLLLYSIVYVEKRYIVPYLLILWITALASLQIPDERWRYCGNVGTRLLCLIFLCSFATSKTLPPFKEMVGDLIHRRERETNTNYLVAERLKQIGLHSGDKIAYVGTGMNATDWARLDNLRIIGEVPITFDRPEKLFNNYPVENTTQVHAFCAADASTRERVQQAFRDAGAVMVVTDGYFCKKFPPEWNRVLLPDQIGELSDPYYESRSKIQYLWLVKR